jgi:hypothetical protein
VVTRAVESREHDRAFPVLSAILARINEYRAILEDYSERLLPNVDWVPTADGDVNVLNDTADPYRFFDATRHAEFLYACVRQTIEEDQRRLKRRTPTFFLKTVSAVNKPSAAWKVLRANFKARESRSF